MKKLILIFFITCFISGLKAQFNLDLGIKGGMTISELSFDKSWNYNKKNKLSYHLGAFSRAGWGRIFVQPEVYLNSRGGDLKNAGDAVLSAIVNFDYTSVDVPVLAGVIPIIRKNHNFRLVAGPVFGFMTSRKVEPVPSLSTVFNKEYFKSHFYGWQLGAGMDYRRLTLDFRMERSRNSVYQSHDFTTRNNLYLISAGFRLF